MVTITVLEAQEHLEQLIDALVSGTEDEVILTVDGQSVIQMKVSPQTDS